MISDALVFLKDRLNQELTPSLGADVPQEEQVVFLDGQNMEPLSFKLGAVSTLLINLEEENTLRTADPYQRVLTNGRVQKIQPDIRLNLYVLFVAHYKQYEDSLKYLSLIIRYFQNHRVFEHHNTPELSATIEKLILELITLPFSEQNEVWNALRATYHPSVLYKVKMLVYQDQEAVESPTITETEIRWAA